MKCDFGPFLQALLNKLNAVLDLLTGKMLASHLGVCV